MKHLVEIDDSDQTGKSLVKLLKTLSKTTRGVGFLSQQHKEDAALLRLMEKGVRSGKADRRRVLKKLNIE